MQLVLAFGDSGTDALVFELSCTVIGNGEYDPGVRRFEVRYLDGLFVNVVEVGVIAYRK